jgi:hypothetical protein
LAINGSDLTCTKAREMARMSHHGLSLERGGGTTPLKIAVSILLAVVVVVSGIAVFYYIQAKDYHDAKYRAQWVLMNDILDSTSLADISLKGMLDYGSDTIVHRAMEGDIVQGSLGSLLDAVWSVREMYVNDKEKNETFSLLKEAVATLLENAQIVAIGLWGNVTLGYPYSENATLNDALYAASDIIAGIHDAIHEGFLVDPAFDTSNGWERSPYSIVDRLNLQYLRNSSADIISLF